MRWTYLKLLWSKLLRRASQNKKVSVDGRDLLSAEDLDDLGPVGTALDINGVRLVFGLRWSPITQDASLSSQLRQARKNGYAHYIVSAQSNAVGMVGPFAEKSAGRLHAASQILAEHFSTTGPELFLFEHAQQCALVGLSDNMPMPGFDSMGSREDIEALAQEFLLMNAGQPIRYFGNVNWVSEIAPLQPAQLVERIDRRTKLSAIPNEVLRRVVAGIGLVVICSASAIGYYVNEKWTQQQVENLKAATNPNVLYEKSIDATLANVGRAGNDSLSPWRATLYTVPTQVGGWTLMSLECSSNQCMARWKSQAGNFMDFERAFRYPTKVRPDMVPSDNGQTILQTVHPALDAPGPETASIAQKHPLLRMKLPKIRDAYLQWASYLQDAKLLPRQNSSVVSAKLFGSDAAISEINRPVVRGTWSLESDLWTLTDIVLPDYVVAEKLEVTPNTSVGGNGSGKGFESNYRYKLTGSFYAQGW